MLILNIVAKLKAHPQSVLARAQRPPREAAPLCSFATSDRFVPTQSGLSGRSHAHHLAASRLLPGGSNHMRTDAPPDHTDDHRDDHTDHTDDHHHDAQQDNHHVSLHSEALCAGLSEASCRRLVAEVLRNLDEDSVCLSGHRCHGVEVAEPVEGDLARRVDRVEQGGAGVKLPARPSLHHLETFVFHFLNLQS